MRVAYEPCSLLWTCHSPWGLEVTKRTIDAIRRLELPRNMSQLGTFLALCDILRIFGPNFTLVAAALNKKLRECPRHTFDGLNEEEITALETIKSRFVELPVVFSAFARRLYRKYEQLLISKLDVAFHKTSLSELTNQFDIGPAQSMMPMAHATQRTANAWQ